MSVSRDDVLHHLVARAGAPSTIGAQLDRLRYGTAPNPDPFRAREDAETHMMAQAQILRCISDFTARREFTTKYKQLQKLQMRTGSHQGYLAVGILRAYQEWSTASETRGLVAVYAYISTLAPDFVPALPKDEPDLVQAFRTGKARRALTMSAEALGDSLLALDGHLRWWNVQASRKRPRAV